MRHYGWISTFGITWVYYKATRKGFVIIGAQLSVLHLAHCYFIRFFGGLFGKGCSVLSIDVLPTKFLLLFLANAIKSRKVRLHRWNEDLFLAHFWTVMFIAWEVFRPILPPSLFLLIAPLSPHDISWGLLWWEKWGDNTGPGRLPSKYLRSGRLPVAHPFALLHP